MDGLGHERFHLFGCCIGGSFAIKIAYAHQDRVRAAIIEQPMGLTPENYRGWKDRCHDWVTEVVVDRSDLDEALWHHFVEQMWRADFVASLTRDEVAATRVPTSVLPGIDDIHPGEIGCEIAQLIPDATTISPWKDSPEHTRRAFTKIREFFLSHTP